MRKVTRTRLFCSAVVPAAGSSDRMNGSDKMFSTVCGIPVLALTLSALQNCTAVDEIVVVVRAEMLERVSLLVSENSIHKVTKVVVGGKTRLESVALGTAAVNTKADIILVHDGARPLVTSEIIEETISLARKCHAAACAVPVKDTVKSAKNGRVISTPDRASLYSVQTPQAFDADIFRASVHNALKINLAVTDDCMAAEAIGVPIRLADGSYENIKITTPTDLIFAEAILRNRRSGQSS